MTDSAETRARHGDSKIRSRLRGLLFSPLAFGLAFMAIVELALPHAFSVQLSPNVNYARNPNGRRNWDDYIRVTSAPREPERRVLLLSNSQGRGPEYSPWKLYATLLQDRLNENVSGPRVRVVNWSFGPSRVPEAIVLLSRAHELRPDVILAVFPPNWFQEEDYLLDSEPTPLSMFPSDVTETAWLYRDRLPESFREHYFTPVTVGRAFLARYTNTYRYRDLPVSYLLRHQPWAREFAPDGLHGGWYAVGATGDGGGRDVWAERPTQIPRLTWPQPALMAMFTETSRKLDAAKLFVFEPNVYPVEDMPSSQLGPVQAVSEHLVRDGWTVRDMMAAVPYTEFLEGSLHLTERGHALFAAALEEQLRPLLDALD